MERSTPAIEAHKQSIANAMSGNKKAWLALFADDGIVRDPVGVSPHDPEGKGFQGKEKLEEFWDLMIGPGNVTVVPHKRYPCGENIAAVSMTAVNIIGELKTFIEMVVVYEVNAEGKLTALSAHWDREALAEQIPAL